MAAVKRNVSAPFHRKAPSIRPEADSLAIEILTFLAADQERLDRFLALTGLDVAGLRQAAGGTGFAESVLDYLTADEALLVAFAADKGYEPAVIETVRLSLSRHFDDA